MDQDTIIERVADAFIVLSLETMNDDTTSGEELRSWSTLQEIIDNVNDHNELMLAAFESVSPMLRDLLTELMNAGYGETGDDDSDATLAWQHLVIAAFNAVQRKIESS